MVRTDTWPLLNRLLIKFILKRVVLYVVLLLLAMTGVFALIHFGPFSLTQLTAGARDPQKMIVQKQALNRSLGVQYIDFLHHLFTFDFGSTLGEGFQFLDRGRVENTPSLTDVNTILWHGLGRTALLWGMTAVLVVPVGIGIGVVLGRRGTPRSHTTATVSGALLRATPMLVVAVVLHQGLLHSETLFFGFDWSTFLVRTPAQRPFFYLGSLTDPQTLVGMVKLTLPYAFSLGSAFLGTLIRVGQRAVHEAYSTEYVKAAKTRGLTGRVLFQRHVLRTAVRPLVATLATNVGILIGGTVIVESLSPVGGFGGILVRVIQNLNDAIEMESTVFEYRILQGTVFVVLLMMLGAKLLEDVLLRLLDGPATDEEHCRNAVWTASEPLASSGTVTTPSASTQRLHTLGSTTLPDRGLLGRIRANPRPVLVWTVGIIVLVAVEFGTVVDLVNAGLPWAGGLVDLPTLLSREVIPNRGYQIASGAWQHTFLGLSPAIAWAIRVGSIYLYAIVWVVWAWVGYYLFRREYRAGGATPIETALGRFRSNGWGMAGFVIVFVVVVAAVFAPTMGPTTLDRTYSGVRFAGTYGGGGAFGQHLELTYFDDAQGTVATTTVAQANGNSQSKRSGTEKIGPLSYDDYDRFHPFGTTDSGEDLFTDMLTGARVYLLIGAGTMVIAGLLALMFGLLSSYYGGAIARGVGILSDGISTAPVLLVIALLSAYFFRDVLPNATISGVGFVTVLFGGLLWPDLWRTMRGPAAAVVSNRWVGTDRASGQPPRTLIWRDIMPRLIGWFLVYGILAVGGTIITTAALSSIGLLPPIPPEWGSFIHLGISITLINIPWHTFVIPALALGVLLVGLTALSDGIRDAIDPAQEVGTSSVGEARGAGGGG